MTFYEMQKYGIWMGPFFKISPNSSKNWLKFNKILEKLGDFAKKIGICMGLFLRGLLSSSKGARPYQNQTWAPPWYFPCAVKGSQSRPMEDCYDQLL